MKPDLTTVGRDRARADPAEQLGQNGVSLPMSRTVVTPAATHSKAHQPSMWCACRAAGDQCAARAVNHDLIRIRHDSILFLDSSDPAAEDRHRGRRAQPPASRIKHPESEPDRTVIVVCYPGLDFREVSSGSSSKSARKVPT